ncbi:hypothetical protein J2Z62_000780 [Mycoplasmoides fastidiosum]|uniref:Lipoprotein n=1 Tax=Mycoplasmoides fastidiosum TaxID=92758 RepID=A0ABU0M065_9BACT|nr:DUF3713 domain-containing protein [Mycoplasmoides fastidiosum]MDQ0514342.1 hypothetical protein [Mycoplasmoides fastidiosum]UUD38056.1 hypothetical protein NPA10_01525 [Mycoplasmoides fastidiosum]
MSKFFKSKKTNNRIKVKGSLFFLGFSVLVSACAPIFQQQAAVAETPKVEKVNDSVIARINGQDYTLTQATHDFMKTVTGAKNFVKSFNDLLIYNFYNSLLYLSENATPDASFVANKFLGQLSSINTEVNNEYADLEKKALETHPNDTSAQIDYKQASLDSNGGDLIRYRKFKSLAKLRTNFIASLLDDNYLNYSGNNFIDRDTLDNPTNWVNLKFKNNSLVDPLAQIIAEFQDFLFEDWYKYTQPVPVVTVSWNYAGADLKASNGLPILESIYDKEKLLLQGISLPSAPNYNYPAFDDVSQSATNTGAKFKNFVTNINTLINSNAIVSPVTNLSDVTDNTYQMQSLTDLGAASNSSQRNAAILQLYNSNSKIKQSVVNGVASNSLTGDNILKNFLGYNGTASSMTGISIDGSTIFKANTALTNSSTTNNFPTKVYDLIQITDSTTSSNINNKWILYKDDTGVHAVAIDGIGKYDTDTAYLKKLILWRSMRFKNNISTTTGASFDLFATLKSYLETNFDAIMLRYLRQNFAIANTQQINQILRTGNLNILTATASVNNTNVFNGQLNATANLFFNGTYNPFWHNEHVRSSKTKLAELLETASDFLNASFFANKLFSLRQKLTASYSGLVTSEPFTKSSSNYFSNLRNGLAANLPFKIAADYTKDPTDYTKFSATNANDGGYTDLEKVYFNTKQKKNPDDAYKDFLTPGKIQSTYQAYLAKLAEYFRVNTFNLNFEYASEEARRLSRFLHFAADPSVEHGRLLLTDIDHELMELTKNSADQQNGIGNIIQQKLYAQNGIDHYFDFQTNSIKVATTNPGLWNFSETFKTSFENNFYLSKVGEDFTKAPVKQVFGGYKISENRSGYNKLLANLWYQKYYLNSTSGYDLLGVDLLNEYQFFLTLNWLIRDNFANFREYLADYIGFNGIAGFVWQNENRRSATLNWTFGNQAFSATNSNDYKFSENPSNIINTPYINKDKSFSQVTNFNLDQNNWSFAKIGNFDAVGFKGLLKTSDAVAKTNTVVGPLLFQDFELARNTTTSQGQLYNWGNFENLVNSITHIKTFAELNSIVGSLSKAYPNISFDNVNRPTVLSPLPGSKPIRLTLTEKVTALLNIVYGYSYTYRDDSEQIFEESVQRIYRTRPTERNHCDNDQLATDSCAWNGDGTGRITDDAFLAFGGSIKNGTPNSLAPYAISNTASNFTTYVAYMQQINFQDVLSTENFGRFMSQISSDVFMQTLLNTAKLTDVQAKAKFDFLNRNNFQKVVVYDQALRNSLGMQWSVVKAQVSNEEQTN